MNSVVGIRWRQADPIAYADAEEMEIRRKNDVVVQGEKG